MKDKNSVGSSPIYSPPRQPHSESGATPVGRFLGLIGGLFTNRTTQEYTPRPQTSMPESSVFEASSCEPRASSVHAERRKIARTLAHLVVNAIIRDTTQARHRLEENTGYFSSLVEDADVDANFTSILHKSFDEFDISILKEPERNNLARNLADESVIAILEQLDAKSSVLAAAQRTLPIASRLRKIRDTIPRDQFNASTYMAHLTFLRKALSDRNA